MKNRLYGKFVRRMIEIYHSKDETPGKEMVKEWEALLQDIDDELTTDRFIDLESTEQKRLEEILKDKDITILTNL